MKLKNLKAVYSICISDALYEEIRIDERWDEKGRPYWSYRADEGLIWSELFGQSNEEPFEKWAFNYHMSMQGGCGTLESFFENHFAKKEIRRRGLLFVYPGPDSPLSQEEYYKKNPLISWLYYKRSFDAVFPVLRGFGKTGLLFELVGNLDNGKEMKFSYKSTEGGKLGVNGKHIINLSFFDERLSENDRDEELGIGWAKETDKGEAIATVYGMHSLMDLMKALEMVSEDGR